MTQNQPISAIHCSRSGRRTVKSTRRPRPSLPATSWVQPRGLVAFQISGLGFSVLETLLCPPIGPRPHAQQQVLPGASSLRGRVTNSLAPGTPLEAQPRTRFPGEASEAQRGRVTFPGSTSKGLSGRWMAVGGAAAAGRRGGEPARPGRAFCLS